MTNMLLLVLILFPFSQCALTIDHPYEERACGEDLSNIWMDVVILIDNDRMSFSFLDIEKIRNCIISIFPANMKFGILPDNPRTSRIGIVTTSDGVIADFNSIGSLRELGNTLTLRLNKTEDFPEIPDSPGSQTGSSLQFGLQEIYILLENQNFHTNRSHYQKLIIIVANEAPSTDLQLARRMKELGIAISTISMTWRSLKSDIATPGLNFNITTRVGELKEMLTQVNCYCPIDWYHMPHPSGSFRKLGVCIRPISLKTTWSVASRLCRNQGKSSHLTTEFTKFKHDFVLSTVNSNSTWQLTPPFSYFIGLSSESSADFMWEQQPKMPLKHQSWNWDLGYPKFPLYSYPVVVSVQTSNHPIRTRWRNVGVEEEFPFVCEMPACDSMNYCNHQDL